MVFLLKTSDLLPELIDGALLIYDGLKHRIGLPALLLLQLPHLALQLGAFLPEHALLAFERGQLDLALSVELVVLLALGALSHACLVHLLVLLARSRLTQVLPEGLKVSLQLQHLGLQVLPLLDFFFQGVFKPPLRFFCGTTACPTF